MPSTAELWILLIPIPECEVFAQGTECPHGSYWDEPKELPGTEWLSQAEGQKCCQQLENIFTKQSKWTNRVPPKHKLRA